MRKEYDFSRAKRGSVVAVPQGKTRITIRLDEDVLQWFKEQVHAAGGGNYQTLINTALRDYIAGGQRGQAGAALEEAVVHRAEEHLVAAQSPCRAANEPGFGERSRPGAVPRAWRGTRLREVQQLVRGTCTDVGEDAGRGVAEHQAAKLRGSVGRIGV